jgi:uncharacterized protein YihD (DUF1040 family)
MRDQARIPELLELINKYWLKYPDLRFNQLIYLLQSEYSNKRNGIGQIKEVLEDGYEKIGFDLFHVEDDEFIDYLKEKIESEKNI